MIQATYTGLERGELYGVTEIGPNAEGDLATQPAVRPAALSLTGKPPRFRVAVVRAETAAVVERKDG